MTPLTNWSTTAVNLAEHAGNIIHTDAGARAAGFESALVAGVTTYAYLSHVAATGWGIAWLEHGGATVRFAQPVAAGAAVECVVVDDVRVDATVDARVCATAVFSPRSEPIDERPGAGLEAIEFVLDESWSDYGFRAGDDCPLYARNRIAHPATWPRIANAFFHEQIVTGPWIHVRSRIAHHGTAPIGSTVHATAKVTDRFESRAGTRAVLDVRITADDVLVAVVDHEAIIEIT
jgi:acyl dehydratase